MTSPELTPQQINDLHRRSDSDVAVGSQHHTLGIGPTQASPGTHNHDGINSKPAAEPFATPVASTLDGVIPTNVIWWSGKSLNQYLSHAVYNGDSMTGAPDSTWWFIHSMPHNNNTNTRAGWARQVAYGMTGNRDIWTRYNSGGDPTLTANWSPWRLVARDNDAAWQDIGFSNTWSNYGAPWATAKFRKLSDSTVKFKGLIKCTAGNNTSVFQLPAGYRPANNDGHHFPAAADGNVGIIRVYPNGVVEAYNAALGYGVAVPWIDIGSVQFYAEQ